MAIVIRLRNENTFTKKEEEMNQKLYLALYEVKEVQKMKKELAEEIKSIYLKMDSIKAEAVSTAEGTFGKGIMWPIFVKRSITT